MKTLRSVTAVVALALSLTVALTTRATVTGQWDFNSGNLTATTGADLAYRGDTAASTVFTTSLIGGLPANVMQFPATTPTQGYIMTHGIAPNGGGSFVNQYTLIMDIMFPTASTGTWRSLFQTSTGNANDGDLFVSTGNGIGISSQYQGAILADTWHRVAFTLDLTKRELGKYIDGVNVVTVPVGSAPLGLNPVQYLSATSGIVDGRWSLDPTALLFSDESTPVETALGFVNSIQIHDGVLSSSLIASLGGATAAGIPVIPEPASGLLLGAGLFLLAVRRTRTNG